MSRQAAIPSIFSFDFHTKFFPQLLWSRSRGKKKEEGSTRFSHNIEFMMLFVLCLILTAIGVPLALRHGSAVGWILGILGIGGILTILIFSILSEIGTKPSFDNFLVWTFFFFIFLGLSIGMFAGNTDHLLPSILLRGVLGLFFGYFIGILAGLWFQYLGWIASIINSLLGLAIIGMIIVDFVLCLK